MAPRRGWTSENDPDEIAVFEVRVYDDDRMLDAQRFASLDEAEAFAEACLDAAPERRTSIEDVLHSRNVDEEVQADHTPIADYPYATEDQPAGRSD